MKKLPAFIFCLILLVFSCSTDSEKKGGNRFLKSRKDSIQEKFIQGMRAPEPVIVDIPKTSNDTSWKSSAYFLFVLKDRIRIEHRGEKTDISDWDTFDSWLKNHAAAMKNEKITLEADDKAAVKRVDTVIKYMKQNGLGQFYLISSLEDGTPGK